MTYRARLVLALAALLGLSGCATAEAPVIAEIRLAEDVSATGLSAQLASETTLSFSSSLGTALVAELSEPLQLEETGWMESYQAGDVAYQPRYRSVVIFLTDGSAIPTGGLVPLGSVVEGFERLEACSRNCRARIVPPSEDYRADGDGVSSTLMARR